MTRVLGIVGGTGPESTIDYYRRLITTWRERGPAGTYPRVIVDSVEGGAIVRLLGAGDRSAVAAEISAAVRELAAAGAGIALLASNATHLAFDEIEATAPIPLIHIVDSARDAAIRGGHSRLGLIGTRFVMEADLYPSRFGPAGIEIVLPTPAERALVHDRYMTELLAGVVLDRTRDELVSIVAAMRDRDSIDGVLLGGTELSLILPEAAYAGVPILNTAQIHIDAAIDWLLV
jgi:aspartate racemase